jgi:hypothetical protein
MKEILMRIWQQKKPQIFSKEANTIEVLQGSVLFKTQIPTAFLKKNQEYPYVIFGRVAQSASGL